VNAVKKQADAEGATVKIVAPKVGGVALDDGKALAADGQLAGMPSVLFDAVAIVLSKDGCEQLLREGAAMDFAKNAFGHLKAIGYTEAAQPLLDAAGVKPDEAVIDLADGIDVFIEKARTRLWEREPKVRMLA
jgi:catalase